MPVKGQHNLLEYPYKAVGERLRSAREGLGLKQAELAAKVGLTQKQISVLEKGRQLPMAARLPSLARAVGATVDWLLTGEGKAPRQRTGLPLETDEERPLRTTQRKRAKE